MLRNAAVCSAGGCQDGVALGAGPRPANDGELWRSQFSQGRAIIVTHRNDTSRWARSWEWTRTGRVTGQPAEEP